MTLDEIRKMNDKDLLRYLDDLKTKNRTVCQKCGALNSNFIIYIQNKREMEQRKLCRVCDKCYEELLEYLVMPDIEW